MADNFQLEAFERGHFGRMIRQERDAAQSQLVQDLRADAVIPVRPVARQHARFRPREAALLHELVGA